MCAFIPKGEEGEVFTTALRDLGFLAYVVVVAVRNIAKEAVTHSSFEILIS